MKRAAENVATLPNFRLIAGLLLAGRWRLLKAVLVIEKVTANVVLVVQNDLFLLWPLINV